MLVAAGLLMLTFPWVGMAPPCPVYICLPCMFKWMVLHRPVTVLKDILTSALCCLRSVHGALSS